MLDVLIPDRRYSAMVLEPLFMHFRVSLELAMRLYGIAVISPLHQLRIRQESLRWKQRRGGHRYGNCGVGQVASSVIAEEFCLMGYCS